MTTKLRRKEFATRKLRHVTDEAFIHDAKTLLGYDLLDAPRALALTAKVLKKLGIEPIDPVTVASYKYEMVQQIENQKSYTDDWGNRIRESTTGEWVTLPLRGYRNEVPEFAVVRAAAVKRELNKANVDADFQIDELHVRHRRAVEDPFMVLVVAGTRIYLDVWNEPKFEGRRTV